MRLLPLGFGLAVAVNTAAQTPPSPPPAAADQPVFRTGTTVVLLDVVIRDKKGRPIPDVTRDEVEVFEEGARQKIEAFRWVETEAPVEGAAAPPPKAPDASRQINLVSLVFDQLGPDGRRLAAKAATSFLDKGLRPNTWVAVFQIDQRLALLQPFTNDAAVLKDAVTRATAGTYKGLIDERAALQEAQKQLEDSGAAEADGATGGRGAPATGGGFAAHAQAQALMNMLRMAYSLQRQQQGATSLYPLLALVRGHETLAGRKTLVYLSEGLQVPPNLEAVFRSTISAANRANVSVYAIDARGLNVERAMAASGDALAQAQRASQRSVQSPGGGSVTKDEIYAADTAESALRLDVEGTLADLSESTGGFLVANTNDFKQGAERLAADLSGHYELTYQPPAAAWDGRFRPIEVKVARKGAVVQARSGYFALPPGESSALLAYEVPLLAALGRPAPPRDFEPTLTLPGIAGIALTIGMAVDANVLIFERIREELRLGRTVKSAISGGFGKALSSIVDSNLTTLIAAVFLFAYGSGPVKGFAVTLCIGILANLFTAVFVSRAIFETVLGGGRRVETLSI